MFVINTSGNRKYTQAHYNKMRKILDKKFNIPTAFEVDQYEVRITIDKYIYFTILLLLIFKSLYIKKIKKINKNN